MRTKADEQKRSKPANPELDAFKAEILPVLEYYAETKHYQPFQAPGGPRPPGVLTEGGEFARRAIAKHWWDEATEPRPA